MMGHQKSQSFYQLVDHDFIGVGWKTKQCRNCWIYQGIMLWLWSRRDRSYPADFNHLHRGEDHQEEDLGGEGSGLPEPAESDRGAAGDGRESCWLGGAVASWSCQWNFLQADKLRRGEWEEDDSYGRLGFHPSRLQTGIKW